MSRTTRPRIPHFSAIIQFTLRLASLGVAIAALVVLIELAVKYPDANNHQGKTFGGAISAAVLAILMNLVELIPLSDPTHKIKRPHTCLVGVGDVVVLGVGIYAIFEVIFSDYSLGDAPVGYPRPWRSKQDLVFDLVIGLVVAAFWVLILDCVGGCRQSKKSKRERAEAQKSSLPTTSEEVK